MRSADAFVVSAVDMWIYVCLECEMGPMGSLLLSPEPSGRWKGFLTSWPPLNNMTASRMFIDPYI